jgi:hypothetical protein
MRLFLCPFCETEKDNGKKTQKTKTREDVEGHGEMRGHCSEGRTPAGDCSHGKQQRRSHSLAVFRALGAATWRRRRNSMTIAAGQRREVWSGGHQGESLF